MKATVVRQLLRSELCYMRNGIVTNFGIPTVDLEVWAETFACSVIPDSVMCPPLEFPDLGVPELENCFIGSELRVALDRVRHTVVGPMCPMLVVVLCDSRSALEAIGGLSSLPSHPLIIQIVEECASLRARDYELACQWIPSHSLVIPEKFQHILRVMGTNIDGKRKVMFAMTAIKGVGRRYANIVLKKADIDLDKRAGECTEEEVEKIITIMSNPRQYKIPDWFLNRQKDIVDGKYSQLTSSYLDSKLREDLERLKKIRAHRGMRHYWGLRVRGQHTKTTGRRGRTVGVSKKK
uniref:Small ribosomal subunit protein uS13 n=2 Tax=Timema TaxID=61471 RepID=A0A7R9IGK1_9NEOP|nr:unnamed protein product [Timema tahoe]